jgi:hypothetical protein
MPEDGPNVPGWIPKLFRAAGVANWLIAGPSMLAPRRSSQLFGAKPPDPPFPLQAWSGMAFMFGFMFQEIAADPLGKRALVRYGYLEKLVSATAVTVGYRAGDAPRATLALLTLSDWALILPFAYAKRRLDAIAG